MSILGDVHARRPGGGRAGDRGRGRSSRLREATCAGTRATNGVDGTIGLFDPDELGGAALFDLCRRGPATASSRVGERFRQDARHRYADVVSGPSGRPSVGLAAWTPKQHAIVTHDGGPDGGCGAPRHRPRPGCSHTRFATGSATACRPGKCLGGNLAPAAPAYELRGTPRSLCSGRSTSPHRPVSPVATFPQASD